MANPSMDRDLVTWLRQQLQEAHPDLLREMLATMVQEPMGAEAQQLCGPSKASGPTPVTATGNESGTPEPAPLSWPSPSCAEAATSRTGCWSPGGGRSGRW